MHELKSPPSSLPMIERRMLQGNTASYVIEPLAAGYGIAIGNPLRRVLLSSILGAAVTALRIEGIRHEFQDIPHVREDVTELVLNVKRLRLRCSSDASDVSALPVMLYLDVTGEREKREGREVIAADLIVPDGVQIANPELHIATLDNEQAHLVIELVVGRGRGHVPATVDPKQDIGLILIDALYSPIRMVNFKVERMLQPAPHASIDTHASIEGERLLVEIETDGTIIPDEALRHSADILVTHFALIGAYDPAPIAEPGPAPVRIPIPPDIDELVIEELHLPRRITNALKRRVSAVGQLLAPEEEDLRSIRNFGDKGLLELAKALWARNFFPDHQEDHRADSSQIPEEGSLLL